MKHWIVMAGFAAASFAATHAADAGEVCVECAEPAASYRCTFADEDVASLGLPVRAAQVVCMTEMAKTGGHRFCRVLQSPLGGICPGQPRAVTLARGQFESHRPDTAQAGAVEPDKAPPATLADLAKDTAKSSGRTLQNAGTAIKDGASQIGNTVGSAFECLTSLFKRC